MKIITAAEMRAIDRATTEKFKIPSLLLMENAGTAVAEFCLKQFPDARTAGVICGKGNNGGDGFVVARKLKHAGKEVRVLLLCTPKELEGDAAKMFSRMGIQPVVVETEEQIEDDLAQGVFESELLVDAMLGTGFKPPVRSLYAAAIRNFSEAPAPVVSVDVPSGADADSFEPRQDDVCRSDAIVTFTAPKPAILFSKLTRGAIVVAGIGTPPEAIDSELKLEVTTSLVARRVLVANRELDSHKGSYGHVLVVGGSMGKAGAPAMAAMAALRIGAGLSTVATPRSVLPIVAGFYPEIMTEPLEETPGGCISERALDVFPAKGKNVLAIGPGIGREPETARFVRSIVDDRRLPVVLDADGLNAFEGHADELDGSKVPLVLTPHPGEMARLTGLKTHQINSDRVSVARRFAVEHHCVVVLKGWRTLTALPDGTVWVNPTGNPGMATGGTGDVLTGMIAGVIAQYPVIEDAVVAAVYLHGLAGDVARDRVGEASLVATHLLTGAPEALKRILNRAHDAIVTIQE